MTATLSIVGCGRLGRTLGRLWQQSATFEIGSVVNRSLESAGQATRFIGAGVACDALEGVHPADAFLIAAPDAAIEGCCDALAEAGAIEPATLVFHCSGALGSDVLRAARHQGASVASVHPVKSFADPEMAVQSFAGTHCGFEGDDRALALLVPAFEGIGARTFRIDPHEKTTYHAGAVMACNYLVTLVDAGQRCFERAGVSREQAREIFEPLLRGTLENVSRHQTADALTGPIARGESAVVAAQLEALESFAPELASLYRALGRATLEIARRQDDAREDELDVLANMLADPQTDGS